MTENILQYLLYQGEYRSLKSHVIDLLITISKKCKYFKKNKFLQGILTQSVIIIQNACHGSLCGAISLFLLFAPKIENFQCPILLHVPYCPMSHFAPPSPKISKSMKYGCKKIDVDFML